MTFSVVAATATELGVATASHWVAVGALVPWCEAGIGVVATQAFTEPAYGPVCLQAMRTGGSAQDALSEAMEMDTDPSVRQVAVLDAHHARVAHHTGTGCLPRTSTAQSGGMVALGNMLGSPRVAHAMVEAFESSTGDLCDRLIDALIAGESAGGDARGRQAAAIKIAPRQLGPQASTLGFAPIDLRVDDHPNPTGELRRLAALHRTYRDIAAAAFPGSGPAHSTEGSHAAASAKLERLERSPDPRARQERALWLAICYFRERQPDRAAQVLNHQPHLLEFARKAAQTPQ